MKTRTLLNFMNITLIMAFLIGGIFINITITDETNLMPDKDKTLYEFISIAFIAVSVGLAALQFVDMNIVKDILTKAFKATIEIEIDEDKYDRLRRKLKAELKDEILNNSLPGIQDTLIKLLKDQISNMSEENIYSKITENYRNDLLESEKIKAIDQEFIELKKVITQQQSRAIKYSYLNLFYGTIITVIAIYVLFQTLTINSKVSLNEYILHLIPRVSLSIFIEIFAFFFLKLYKNNLNEIKYYINERVNIDMKIIALKAAIYYESNPNLDGVVTEFVNTERNFILKKDESTVELQKSIIESNNSNKTIDALVKLIKVK